MDLVQTLHRELDWADDPPESVDGLTGNVALLPQWINQSHIDIQTQADWRWLRREWRLDMTPGKLRYDVADVIDRERESPIDGRFESWYVQAADPVRSYSPNSANFQGELTWVDWEYYRYQESFYSDTAGIPFYIARDPQDRICLLGVPDDPDHYLIGQYNQGPQELVANDDEPEMPWQHRMTIVWLALTRYGYTRAAEEALAQASAMYSRTYRALQRTQTGRLAFAMPLVE